MKYNANEIKNLINGVNDVEIMDAERYNETICANSCMEFSDIYEDTDKVAVIVIR